MKKPEILIFQSAKLGDLAEIIKELEWAERLLKNSFLPSKIYGNSGGSISATAFAFNLAAKIDPVRWGCFSSCLHEVMLFLQKAQNRKIRRFNRNLKFGFYNLNPLRRWFENYLTSKGCQSNLRFSDLPLDLYLCASIRDGILSLFGKENSFLSTPYHFIQVGPPEDACILDALIASISTMLSTEPAIVNGEYYRDCRPALVDIGAMVCDLEKCEPERIMRDQPLTKIRPWKLNVLSSSFIMHSQHERNQHLLASCYLDLKHRHMELQSTFPGDIPLEMPSPSVTHVQLPYVGSTEAATNMRDSVAHKDELMDRFATLLNGQLDHFDFSQPVNIIYGAGGFSGILAGLVTTRAVEAGFKGESHYIQQIYGVSAGVLNGFFHAVQVAANNHPEIYTDAAHHALADLEDFVAHLSTSRVLRINRNPLRLWQGVANLEPLENFLNERLSVYTGSKNPQQLTFDDIRLPLTVAVSRGDGFTDFLGMSRTGRKMKFFEKEIKVLETPVVKAVIAGWSMNTYVQPALLHGQAYRDGGGTFYDIGLFVACLDPHLVNQINIHLDEPEGHSYNIPSRPDIMRVIFDTHNYTFPEERRRMFHLTNLLYEHFRLRAIAQQYQKDPKPDFRQNWDIRDFAVKL